MELSQVVETLEAWAEQHRLLEEAYGEFEQWLGSRGGVVGTFSRDDIEVTFHDEALVFRAGRQPVRPVVVTCLALAVYGGECPLGTFKVLTDLDGRRCGIEVELGADVALEGLGGQTWRLYE